jgi:uncharacterized protein (TIGR03083 family)
VEETLEFPALLRLIDERSAAFRAAVVSVPDLEARVPTCPEWTLLDLAEHLGGVHRFWAAAVSAGPAAGPPAKGGEDAPRARGALLAWSAAAARLLLDALREAGPDRGCWTWWGGSQSPLTAGAVARHQVQEAMVHAYDAQVTAGAAEPLPGAAALDGVDEFLATCVAGSGPWPHEAAVVEYHASEGGAWRLSLSAEGARVARLPVPGPVPAAVGAGAAAAIARGTAAELVLALYGRVPLGSLRVDGDQRLFEQLRDWDAV